MCFVVSFWKSGRDGRWRFFSSLFRESDGREDDDEDEDEGHGSER
jgi:hypothetical protein